MDKKVLVVATSQFTRGGITSVVNAYKGHPIWRTYSIKWLATHIDKGNSIKLLYFLRSLIVFLLIVNNYDLVHIHLSEPQSAKRKKYFFTLAKVFRKKVIVHFHSFSPETTINGKNKALYFNLFSEADRVIVLSEQWRSWVKQYLSLSTNIEVIYNPSPVVKAKIEVNKANIILYAGTITERKGYSDLIKAFAKIASIYPDWSIVFIGNGEIKQGQMLASSLNIGNQVSFLGWVTGKAKDDIFLKSKVFCLPSYAEGFPMAILDAWAYGLPVVTTPVGGLPDVLEDEINALVFNAGDIDGLSVKLENIISNTELRTKISKASLVLAATKFNINTISSQMSKLYNDVLTTPINND